MDVHRVARVCAAGHGGQVLLTGPLHALLTGHWPAGLSDVTLGSHRLTAGRGRQDPAGEDFLYRRSRQSASPIAPVGQA